MPMHKNALFPYDLHSLDNLFIFRSRKLNVILAAHWIHAGYVAIKNRKAVDSGF